MDSSHRCVDCGAMLQADNGHDQCPACLGRDHLVEALSENLCMNCSYLPPAVRLAQLCPESSNELLPLGQVAQPRRLKHWSEATIADVQSSVGLPTGLVGAVYINRNMPKNPSQCSSGAG